MKRFHSRFHGNVGMNLQNLGRKNKRSFPWIDQLFLVLENFFGGIFVVL